jgi:hypothetical protein
MPAPGSAPTGCSTTEKVPPLTGMTWLRPVTADETSAGVAVSEEDSTEAEPAVWPGARFSRCSSRCPSALLKIRMTSRSRGLRPWASSAAWVTAGSSSMVRASAVASPIPAASSVVSSGPRPAMTETDPSSVASAASWEPWPSSRLGMIRVTRSR